MKRSGLIVRKIKIVEMIVYMAIDSKFLMKLMEKN